MAAVDVVAALVLVAVAAVVAELVDVVLSAFAADLYLRPISCSVFPLEVVDIGWEFLVSDIQPVVVHRFVEEFVASHPRRFAVLYNVLFNITI